MCTTYAQAQAQAQSTSIAQAMKYSLEITKTVRR